jgi:hypothetical protein
MATHVCSSDNVLLRSKKINGRLRSPNTVVFSAPRTVQRNRYRRPIGTFCKGSVNERNSKMSNNRKVLTLNSGCTSGHETDPSQHTVGAHSMSFGKENSWGAENEPVVPPLRSADTSKKPTDERPERHIDSKTHRSPHAAEHPHHVVHEPHHVVHMNQEHDWGEVDQPVDPQLHSIHSAVHTEPHSSDRSLNGRPEWHVDNKTVHGSHHIQHAGEHPHRPVHPLNMNEDHDWGEADQPVEPPLHNIHPSVHTDPHSSDRSLSARPEWHVDNKAVHALHYNEHAGEHNTRHVVHPLNMNEDHDWGEEDQPVEPPLHSIHPDAPGRKLPMPLNMSEDHDWGAEDEPVEPPLHAVHPDIP